MAKENLPSSDRKKLLEARLKKLKISPSVLSTGESIFGKYSNYLSTGVQEIDEVLGTPGFSCGSLVELVGESSSGKSYLAMKCAAHAHEQGKRVAWMNIENSFYGPRAEAVGVHVKNEDLFELYSGLGSGEEWGELIKLLTETNEYAYIIVDSVTAMIPTADFDKDLADESKIGAHARMCTRLTQKLINILSDKQTTIILINQFRYGQGVMKGQMVKKPTGGEGIGFYCNTRLVFSKVNGVAGELHNEKKEVIGGNSKVFVLKNRFGAPYKSAEFPIYFVAEESNPIVEFIMKAKSKQFELIKESRKVLKYTDEDGVIHETKNEKEFIRKLLDIPAPSNKSKNDTSTNVFEYICRKIKMNEKSVARILFLLEQKDDHDTENYEGPDLSEMPDDEIKVLFGESDE